MKRARFLKVYYHFLQRFPIKHQRCMRVFILKQPSYGKQDYITQSMQMKKLSPTTRSWVSTEFLYEFKCFHASIKFPLQHPVRENCKERWLSWCPYPSLIANWTAHEVKWCQWCKCHNMLPCWRYTFNMHNEWTNMQKIWKFVFADCVPAYFDRHNSAHNCLQCYAAATWYTSNIATFTIAEKNDVTVTSCTAGTKPPKLSSKKGHRK